MIRFITGLFMLGILAGCAPSDSRIYPEHYSARNCFFGSHVFDLELDIPPSLGEVIVATQFSNGSRGLQSTCELLDPASVGAYRIYSGEVHRGESAICASVRTSTGHHLSCSSVEQVQRAIAAPLGSSDALIRLSQWQPFPTN